MLTRRQVKYCSQVCARIPKPIPEVECARQGCGNTLTREQIWWNKNFCCHPCSTAPEPYVGPECANPECSNRLTRRQVSQGGTKCSLKCVAAIKTQRAVVRDLEQEVDRGTWDYSPALLRSRHIMELMDDQIHNRPMRFVRRS